MWSYISTLHIFKSLWVTKHRGFRFTSISWHISSFEILQQIFWMRSQQSLASHVNSPDHISLSSKKLKFTLVQALRLCTGRTAHTGSRGIALLFLDHGTRRDEGSASRPGRSLPQGKNCTGRTAHRVSRGLAVLFLYHDTRRGWGFSVMPRPLFPQGKNCTGRTAHRGSRGIAVLFLYHDTRRGWGFSVTPRPLFPHGETVQAARPIGGVEV